MKNRKKIVIVGPTASGKTGVSVMLAKQIGGEVISADSRTIYQGMDIGTAKPTLREREGITHFGFDLVKPDERFSVYDWKQYAVGKIKEIEQRGAIPIIVGGTGLYIDALIFDYQFNEDVKRNYTDRREMNNSFLIYGIKWEREEIKQRILSREQQMFSDMELLEETEQLVSRYDWELQAMKSNVYRFVWQMMKGVISKEEAIEKGALKDFHLAKRQITWFKRNEKIKWCRLEELNKKIIEDLKMNL